jgi:hypothetical protein
MEKKAILEKISPKNARIDASKEEEQHRNPLQQRAKQEIADAL